MKCIRKNGMFFCILILMAGSACLVNAYYSRILYVTNHLGIGDVRIEIIEESEENGVRGPFENGRSVMPGDTVSKIPSIRSMAESCFVRFRVSGQAGGEKIRNPETLLGGINPEWIRIGEYFYRKQPLEQGEASELFQTFHLPAEWGNETAHQEVVLTIYAEAIQSAYFTPDFERDLPWGDAAVYRCEHTDAYTVTEGEDVRLEVELTQEAKSFVSLEEDFFKGFEKMMPGGTYADQVCLKNASRDSVELYFHEGLDCPLEDAYMKALLGKIRLSLLLDGRLLYEGPLYDERLLKEKSLGILAPDTEKSLEFKLEVPAELDNLYALETAHLRWYFSVYHEDEPEQEEAGPTAMPTLKPGSNLSGTPDPDAGSEASGSPTPSQTPDRENDSGHSSDKEQQSHAGEKGSTGSGQATGNQAVSSAAKGKQAGIVRTGDEQPITFLVFLLIGSVWGSAGILLWRKRKNQ